MTVPDVKGQWYPTKEEAKATFLRTVAAAAERNGKTVNVLPGSLEDFRAEAIASIVAPAYANNKLARQSLSPLEADDDQIEAVAEAYGVFARASAPSTGRLVVSVASGTGGTVTIPAGYSATAPDGTQVETTAVAIVSDGGTVDVQATAGGASTNQAAGTQFTWDSASVAYLKRTATVDSGGLTLGRDADTPAKVRERLLERLSSPGTGGNWAYVKALAEAASSSVQVAFVYPAVGGPGSYGVALLSDETDRSVSATVVNEVGSAITAALPGHAYLNITSSTPEGVDVIFAMRLPSPVFAGGSGGGWRDASPWPSSGASGVVKITSYNSGTGTITTNASALGTLAVGSHIGIWDYSSETMYEFEVLTAVVGGGGFVEITVVGGFPKDLSNMYISAGAENLVGYAAAVLAACKTLGPGEKTSNTWILPRGSRKPVPTATEWPTYMSTRFGETVIADYPEVADFSVYASYTTATTTPKSTPTVPTSHLDPPNVLVPKALAFKPS